MVGPAKKRILKCLLVIVAVLALIPLRVSYISKSSLTNPKSDVASDARGAEAWKKAMQGFQAKPSTDATPISFSIEDVNYSVPRNYILRMDNWNGGPQTIAVLKVTFPGFEPLTDKTTQCLTKPMAFWPKDCVPIEFTLIGKTPVSDDERFRNASTLFHSQIPKPGPAGFEMYETGADNARLETYRKVTAKHTLLIHCIIFPPKNNGEKWGTCSNESRLLDNNTLEYSFYLDQLGNAEQIDNGLRNLVDSLTLTGGKQ